MSKILHFKLLHLEPLAPRKTVIGIYIFLQIFALLDAGGMFKNAKFCTLQFCTLALGDLNFNLYISLVLNV